MLLFGLGFTAGAVAVFCIYHFGVVRLLFTRLTDLERRVDVWSLALKNKGL